VKAVYGKCADQRKWARRATSIETNGKRQTTFGLTINWTCALIVVIGSSMVVVSVKREVVEWCVAMEGEEG
jgi:hypothetical protein